jgi:hypothetical protein
MIHIKPYVEKPYTLDKVNLGEYIKELKQLKALIEKHDFTFERAGLINTEYKKDVLAEINEQIKLCEYYFKTIKRKDLFKWIFTEKIKKDSWSEERDRWVFSNGKIKGIIEISKREKSTEIVSKVESDSELSIYFHTEETHKTLRSEESIKIYINEVKIRLEKELSEAEYDKREQRFYDFILNCGGVA